MQTQQRILKFVTLTNWYLTLGASGLALLFGPLDFTLGVLSGGLIVTLNFHLLARTLKKALTPPHPAAPATVIIKFYLRFALSGLMIFILISRHYVNPFGLFFGLSVVVASIFLATLCELKKLILKEAL